MSTVSACKVLRSRRPSTDRIFTHADNILCLEHWANVHRTPHSHCYRQTSGSTSCTTTDAILFADKPPRSQCTIHEPVNNSNCTTRTSFKEACICNLANQTMTRDCVQSKTVASHIRCMEKVYARSGGPDEQNTNGGYGAKGPYQLSCSHRLALPSSSCLSIFASSRGSAKIKPSVSNHSAHFAADGRSMWSPAETHQANNRMAELQRPRPSV